MRLEEFLEKNAAVKAFDKGQIVFKEGDQADAAYCVLEGEIEIFKDDDGRGAVMARLGPGEIFGEMALLRFDRYTLSARAADAVKLHVISPALLQEQLRQTPPLVRAIVDALAERMRGVNEVLIDLDRADRG